MSYRQVGLKWSGLMKTTSYCLTSPAGDLEMASYLFPPLKAFKMFLVLATRLFNCAAAHATLHQLGSAFKYVPLIIKELFNCPG